MGDQPTSVGEMLARAREGGMGLEQYGLYYGLYRGFVVNNKDPQKLGRVQIRLAQLASDNKIETWAWPFGQPAGNDFGDFFIPPKGSMVWVSFENGDPQFPLWTGGQWGKSGSGGEVPEEARREEPTNRVRKSQKIVMEFDDEAGEIRFKFKSGGASLTLKESGEIILSGTDIQVQGSSGVTMDTPTTTMTAATQMQGPATAQSTMAVQGGLTSIGGGSISGGFTVDGKNFITHAHNGVDPGGGVSGGVN